MTNLEKKIVDILKSSPIAQGLKSVAIFGSYAKGTETVDSDIDLLVELTQPYGLGFIEAELMLSDQLGKNVDLLTEEAISRYLIDEIRQTKKIIYER